MTNAEAARSAIFLAVVNRLPSMVIGLGKVTPADAREQVEHLVREAAIAGLSLEQIEIDLASAWGASNLALTVEGVPIVATGPDGCLVVRFTDACRACA